MLPSRRYPLSKIIHNKITIANHFFYKLNTELQPHYSICKLLSSGQWVFTPYLEEIKAETRANGLIIYPYTKDILKNI